MSAYHCCAWVSSWHMKCPNSLKVDLVCLQPHEYQLQMLPMVNSIITRHWVCRSTHCCQSPVKVFQCAKHAGQLQELILSPHIPILQITLCRLRSHAPCLRQMARLHRNFGYIFHFRVKDGTTLKAEFLLLPDLPAEFWLILICWWHLDIDLKMKSRLLLNTRRHLTETWISKKTATCSKFHIQ